MLATFLPEVVVEVAHLTVEASLLSGPSVASIVAKQASFRGHHELFGIVLDSFHYRMVPIGSVSSCQNRTASSLVKHQRHRRRVEVGQNFGVYSGKANGRCGDRPCPFIVIAI